MALKVFSWRLVVPAVIVSIAAVALTASAAAKAGWTEPSQLNQKGFVIFGVESDVGNNGYAVVSWSQITKKEMFDHRKPFGLIRVKAPGAGKFGPVKRLGRIGQAADLSIGSGGHTVLTWSNSKGQQIVISRGPRTGWSKPQRIEGGEPGWARVEVGPDGTAVLQSAVRKGLSGGGREVVVSVREPGRRKFSPWRAISTSSATIGGTVDLVVGRNGRATVVWAASCPIDPPFLNARYVDIDGANATEPIEIENTKCVTFDLDIEADDAGYQYLRIGGSLENLTGVKLSVRRPGEPFPEAEWVSEPGRLSGGGDMAVSRKGRVFLAWRDEDQEKDEMSLRFATFQKDQKLVGPAVMSSARMDRSRRMDLLQDMAFLPNGKLSTFWYEHWLVPVSQGAWRFRFGTKQIDSVSPKIDHLYKFPIAPRVTPGDVKIEVAPDGSQFARWTVSREGWADAIRWMAAP